MRGTVHNKMHMPLPGFVLIRRLGFKTTFGHGGQSRQVALNIPFGHLLALRTRQRHMHQRCKPCVKTDETTNDINFNFNSFDKLFRDKNR
jgi:hypothetical protein